ncbi:MAG TPA: hypothetical protein VM049_01520 [Gaiellaceae bacterium]|nr:hypothetical protein [Gaiellaceae bacterium]
MRRTVLLAVLLLTGCAATPEPKPVPLARAAEPQHAELGWKESYPDTGERLRFDVDALDVRESGWSVEIAVSNDTRSSFELGADPAQLSFGLMLFASGRLDEVEEASRSGRLPEVRLPDTIRPAPPDVLAPGATWHATLTGRGSLADGSFVRVSFGPLVAVGDPPEDMLPVVVWITDRSHKL